MSPTRAEKHFHFDTASVLEPIPDEPPAGPSLRYEGTYDKIREAREEDNPTLARGVWKAPLKRAEWSQVVTLCLDALQNRSKDLQIAAWLTEAWQQLYGLAGLREGLRVATALCERFWDSLHPLSHDGDFLEYRLAPIEWMNDKLPPLVRQIPITQPQSDDVKIYCWNDWESAIRPRGEDESDTVTQAQFQQSVMMTPTAFYSALVASIESAADACTELETLLGERCGDRAASLRQLANTLSEIRGVAVSVLSQRDDVYPSRPSVETEGTAVPQGSAEDVAATAPEPPRSVGAIRDRTDAYRRLAEAADYLARTEPHSPTPYLVRRAIAWGSMRLEDLLPELVRNDGELTEIYRLLQIPRDAK
jgi:type VI secretion system ImpA family protein